MREEEEVHFASTSTGSGEAAGTTPSTGKGASVSADSKTRASARAAATPEKLAYLPIEVNGVRLVGEAPRLQLLAADGRALLPVVVVSPEGESADGVSTDGETP